MPQSRLRGNSLVEVHVPKNFAQQRISDFPAAHASQRPGSLAAVFVDHRITYAELAHQVDRCGRAMIANGVRKGDRIAVLSTPRPEFLVILLAGIRIGAIVVGLNPSHQIDEFRYVVGDCRPIILFGFISSRGRNHRKNLHSLLSEFECIQKLVIMDDGEGGTELPYRTFESSATTIDNETYTAFVDAVLLDDIALIVHTSGTTGQPKGAMITHRNLGHCAAIQLKLFPINPLRMICNLPISHTVCTCDVLSYVMAAGGTVVFQERFNPAGVLSAIESEQITCLLQISAMCQFIAAEAKKRAYDTSSLQALFYLGAPLPRDTISELKKLCGTVITGWGLTEATSSVTFTEKTDGIVALANTVGMPAPTYEIRIVNHSGNEVPHGNIGEVQIRGPCVMAGYYGKPGATAEIINDERWLNSGDLGRIDETCRLVLVGRIKDMFKSGGYNVYPREIEIVLESHPSVACAVVVGVPDPIYYEVGSAFLLPKPHNEINEQGLRVFCSERIANYKIPKTFIVRDKFPMLAIGKVDRAALRKEAIELSATKNGSSQIP